MSVAEINAWSTDYAKDPLAALASNLVTATGTASLERREQFKQAAAKMFRVFGPGAIRLATAGLLDLNAALEKEVGDALANAAAERLNRFEEDVGSMDDFRHSLQELAADESDQPMVVIVDELDRCRPSYALEVLEAIKHVFDVANVLFVLAVNREQLDASVGVLYGTTADPESYFRRFFDIELTLPLGDRSQFIRKSLRALNLGHRDAAAELFAQFLGSSPFSIRLVNQTLHHYAFVRSAFPLGTQARPGWSVLLATAIVLRLAVPEAYRAFARGEISDWSLADQFFALPWTGQRGSTEDALIVEAAIAVAGEDIQGSGEGSLMQSYLQGGSLEAGSLLDHCRQIRRSTATARQPWQYVAQRVEMLLSNVRAWS